MANVNLMIYICLDNNQDMKLPLIFYFCSLFLFLSCKKQDDSNISTPVIAPNAPLISLNSVRFVENGETVVHGYRKAIYYFDTTTQDTTFLLTFGRFVSSNIYLNYSFNHIRFAEDKYQMKRLQLNEKKPTALASLTVDGDQGAGLYVIDSTAINEFEIVKIDRVNETIQGRFQVHLVNLYTSQFSFQSDTLHITDGVFNVPYERY